jgi:putative nucleotidyltransferase with HDIG domain
MKLRIEGRENLSHLRTPDRSARRRCADDGDLILVDRNPFRQDADTKVGLSKAFRQLMFKTQVVSSPVNCLIRNRASHTMEVVNLATTIAEILGLNVDLARAIALGHDIGHVPFGHVGEEFLTARLGKPFRHEVFGVVRAQKIERLGKGINATHQSLSGILYHSRGKGDMTVSSRMSAEAVCAMYSDKIGYTLSDYNDIVKRHLLSDDETKKVTGLINKLGSCQRERAANLVLALCRESVLAGKVSFKNCPEAGIFNLVKDEMYHLYDQVNSQGVEDVLARVYDFVSKKISEVNPVLLIALMTDEDILFLSSKTIFDRTDFNQTSVAEQLPYARALDPKMDLTDPDMNW